MRKIGLLSAAALAFASGIASAAPRTYDLPQPTAQLREPKHGEDRRGFEAATNNCMSCHSVDYIAMQPPNKGAAFWEAEVSKMIKVYHAPIDAQDGESIAHYLSENY